MATDKGLCKSGGASELETQCSDDPHDQCIVVVWLRTDLRLHDNGSLAAAAEMVASGKADAVSGRAPPRPCIHLAGHSRPPPLLRTEASSMIKLNATPPSHGTPYPHFRCFPCTASTP